MLLSAEQVVNSLGKKNYVLLDARWYLKDKKLGFQEYKKSHIPNSIFFDIEKFSNINSNLPHMIPDKNEFEKLISNIGISNNDNIIVYDQSGFVSSTRVWFIFNVFGHKKISVLNGGFNEWKKKKLRTTSKILSKDKKKFSAIENMKLIVSKKQIKILIKNPSDKIQIVDCRPSKRFKGIESEPRKGLLRGKIPGSINIPFNLIHNKNGLLLDRISIEELLYKRYNLKEKSVICSCGSGITACNIIFALKVISHDKVYLYDGSWAEWGKISNEI